MEASKHVFSIGGRITGRVTGRVSERLSRVSKRRASDARLPTFRATAGSEDFGNIFEDDFRYKILYININSFQ